MTFTSEIELRDAVIDRIFNDLKTLFTNTDIYSFEEVPHASGVTDIVIANVSDKYLIKRMGDLKLERGILHDSYLQLYILLRKEGQLKVKNLTKNFGENRSIILRGIKWLSKHGYLDHDGGVIELTNVFRKHITNTYAFELKLKNWKRALKQAFAAKTYSNIQFVILDDDYVNPAVENKDLFEQYNIGLISVRPEAKFKVHYRPKKSKPYSELGIWKFNEYSFEEIKCEVRC